MKKSQTKTAPKKEFTQLAIDKQKQVKGGVIGITDVDVS